MPELPDLTAVELVAQYRAGTLSPVEVTEAVLARVEAREPELHALYAYDPSGAREDAKASESRWHVGEPLGPIDGVPLTLKENIATRGTPVPLGTAATSLTPAPEDAPAGARVRESGGVLLGKTTMPDYGMLTSGLSSFHTASRNPWDTTRTPGGSSAGAGSAAAAGYGPLHVGTDIGGSIRLPMRLVRSGRAEAELRAGAGGSAVPRPCRRADDADRGGHRVADERSVRCGRSRSSLAAAVLA